MKAIINLLIYSIFISSLSACHEEFHPLANSQSINCQDSTLQNNIIGTWHFVSSYDLVRSGITQPTVEGTVTFTINKTVVDPDSLFHMHFIDTKAQQETYDPSVHMLTPGGDFGQVFAIYLSSPKGTQADAFTVASNTCRQIELVPAHSNLLTATNNSNEHIVLIRL